MGYGSETKGYKISCKWVHKIKNCPNGLVERHKVRLVARGFLQQYGLDYDKTFSLMVKTTSRVLHVLAASKERKLWQIDVKNVFLHRIGSRDLHELTKRVWESSSSEVCMQAKKGITRLYQGHSMVRLLNF